MGPASADPNQTGNYIGTSVDYAARLVDLAGEGRIVVSEVVATFVREEDITDIDIYEHGLKELAGIGEKPVFEVLYDGQQAGPPAPLDDAGSTSASGNSSSGEGSGPAVTTMYEPSAGLRIKDYELLAEIGEGGMGKVFKARHVGMGRMCVLKLIKDSLLQPGNDEILERFYREIQVIARLKHPNIIQAYHSSSRDDEHHFLVMEYVPGITLDRWIAQQGVLPLGEACDIVRQASYGLQCIADHGLVHRDIKPSNLMIADEKDQRVVKILDLGLALLVEDSEDRITQFRDRAMGTAYYMAPEQWSSSSVDIRADIYALGCTFYHMLAGRPPFQDSKFSQQHAHRSVMPSPPATAENLPPAVWEILRKMLEKEPDGRYGQPSEVAEALDRFSPAATAGTPAPPPPELSESRDGSSRDTDVDTPVANGDRTDVALDSDHDMPPPGHSPLRTVAPWVAILAILLIAVLLVGRIADLRSRPVLDSPAHREEAKHLVLTMPGMNGGWWFDEIPWFFPEMRQHLLRHMTVAEFTELQSLARKADVNVFYEHLQTLCERSLKVQDNGVPVATDKLNRRFEYLRDARPFDEVDPEKRDESSWARADNTLQEERQGEEDFQPADWHLRALLRWKLRSTDAAELFERARDAYHTQSKELQALCLADAAVMKQQLRRYQDAGLEFRSARTTIPQVELAAALAIFTYAMQAEVRLFDESKPRGDIPELFAKARAEPFMSRFDDNHPLHALLLSREALYYLETWQLQQAQQKAVAASEKFSDLTGPRRAANLYFRSRQFMAMAYHFLGRADDAAAEFKGLLQFIDDLLATDDIAERAKPQWRRLKPNLLGRLADVLFFGKGQAAEAATVLDEAAREAQRFAGGPKAAYLARILFKRAIAYALAGDPEQAQTSYDAAKAVTDNISGAEPRAVYGLFQDVAAALLLPPSEQIASLWSVAQQAALAADYDSKRPSRDDMQLLLFVCSYLLHASEQQPGALKAEQVGQIRQLHDDLAAPLRRDGQEYLKRIREAAEKLTPGLAPN
jgi:serine/threonine protein kinase